MILCQKDATVHSPSYCILLPERAFRDKKKRRYYLFFRRWGRFARNVPSGEERGETDVFAGHVIGYSSSILPPLQVFVRHLPSGLTLSKQKLISSSYLLVIKNLHATMFSFEVVRNIRKPSGKCFSRALIGYSNLGYPVLLGSPSDPKLATDKWLPGLLPYIK